MERRQFIKTSALSLLGLYACNGLKLRAQEEPLGVQLYTVRVSASEDIEQTLEKLRKLGYINLEIFGYDGKFFGKTTKEFAEILKNTGQRLISSHHVADLKNRKSITHNWELAVEELAFLEAKYMVYAYIPAEDRTKENYYFLPELFNRFGEITQEGGIQFAYHNHDFEFENFEKSNFYDFLLNETSDDLVKMELDLYWIVKAGRKPQDYFEKHPGRFPLWHLKDIDSEGKTVELGTGLINFDELFAYKKQSGLEYWFVEQDESTDPFNSLQISANFLKIRNY